MPVRTVVNRGYLRDVVWTLRTTLNGLNTRAGLSAGYIYQLAPEDDNVTPRDVTLSTVDRLHNAIESMMIEMGINPPDDLWEKIVLHEETDIVLHEEIN